MVLQFKERKINYFLKECSRIPSNQIGEGNPVQPAPAGDVSNYCNYYYCSCYNTPSTSTTAATQNSPAQTKTIGKCYIITTTTNTTTAATERFGAKFE